MQLHPQKNLITFQEKEGESGKVGSRSGTPQPASVKQADKEAADER